MTDTARAAGVSRRGLLAGAAVGATALGVAGVAAPSGSAQAAPSGGYLVGAGRGDITGAIAGQGMMGYSDLSQVATGLLQRVWARAYIIADAATGTRIVFVNADLACIFESHRVGVMKALTQRFGNVYTNENVNINATHNHNSCGGTAWDYAYVLAALGHRENSYRAEVDGIVEAIVAAHNSLAPGTLELGHSELHDASANRSLQAFVRNPAADQKHFPEHIDPQVTALRLRQGGTVIGEITWFATHGTSLTDANTLISSDNKGYASYLAESANPGVVAAFPQTNAGDMTPNLWLRKMHPGGPTADHRTNRVMIGDRQHRAAQRAFAAARPLTGAISYAYRFLDLSDIRIDGHYTPDGKPTRTTPAIMGAAAAATSTEDNTRSQLSFLQEGVTLPFAQALGVDTSATPPEWAVAIQAPKFDLFPLGYLPPRPWIEQVLPIQLIRIGDLVLACGPAEFTIVAGLRIRRIVADTLRVPLENVLMQGYANGYSQYVTTPEEFLSQQYEGGETLFGRYTLCAYMQEFDRLARTMAAGRRGDLGPTPADTSGLQPNLLAPVPADTPVRDTTFGAVVSAPRSTYVAGQSVSVSFSGAHPSNRVRRVPADGSRPTDGYYVIERFDGGRWITTEDDTGAASELDWKRPDGQDSASIVTITWRIPQGAHGRHRIRYFGDVKSATGRLRPIVGVSPAFEVT
ncbi:neutral/alkaline non-lysosomal ceramidase N-terminal domain-containing protein [Gordonia sp. L191]|uniref:neutral/alkaline non-lysosomal ceramidase N-terminal domain-containing protein n=1 Tax=Gordonia sp. L191 TaxID=2982699 RepID=UPI0024C091AA|nr:neutral/alkaline non-lysosomal ceramidase N-terminal domain-containing protein [Gordonia sp. L191]WHU47268.1 neutral/alkaline non-lysosomal ceramidase N-terminal domain-containing protein [Gordonia sp. L191]